jgi:hypothetical protein
MQFFCFSLIMASVIEDTLFFNDGGFIGVAQ